MARSKHHCRAKIDDEENRSFALVAEGAHMRHSRARRDIAVEMAHVVALRPGYDVVELEPAPASPMQDGAGQSDGRLATKARRRGETAQPQQRFDIEIDPAVDIAAHTAATRSR